MTKSFENFEYHSQKLKFLYLLEKSHKKKIKIIPPLKKHFLLVGDIETQDKLLQNYIKDFKWDDDVNESEIPSLQFKSLFREATNLSISYSNANPQPIKDIDSLGLVVNSSLDKEKTIKFFKKYLNLYKEKIIIFYENSPKNNGLFNEIENLIKESNRSDVSIHTTSCKSKEGIQEAFDALIGDLSLDELKKVNENLEENLYSKTVNGLGILLVGDNHRIINLISKLSLEGSQLVLPSAVKKSKYQHHMMEYLIYADPELSSLATYRDIEISLEGASGVAIVIDASKSLEQNEKYLDQYLLSKAINRNNFITNNKIKIFYDTYKGTTTSEEQIKEYLNKHLAPIEIVNLPSEPTECLNNNCEKLLFNFCKEMSSPLKELKKLLFAAENLLLKKSYDLKLKGLDIQLNKLSTRELSPIFKCSKQYKSLFNAYSCIQDLQNILKDVDFTLKKRENLCVKLLKSKRKVLLEENFFVSLYHWILSFLQNENKYLNQYLKKYDQKLTKDNNEFELSIKTDTESLKNNYSSLKNNPHLLFKKEPYENNKPSPEIHQMNIKHS